MYLTSFNLCYSMLCMYVVSTAKCADAGLVLSKISRSSGYRFVLLHAMTKKLSNKSIFKDAIS